MPAYTSSVFSRKITTSSRWGSRTGDGTPGIHRTGRTHEYRSSTCRIVTFRERMPPPTGVVSGPLIATRNSVRASRVSCGSHSPVRSLAFSPASTSIHAIERAPSYALATAASTTRRVAAQMSGPIPSPSMNGTMGRSGTWSPPSGAWSPRSGASAIFRPSGGTTA